MLQMLYQSLHPLRLRADLERRIMMETGGRSA